MDFQIKISNCNKCGRRSSSRWTGGEKLDCAIAKLTSAKESDLSIRLLEEIEKKEALEKYGSKDQVKTFHFHHYLRI